MAKRARNLLGMIQKIHQDHKGNDLFSDFFFRSVIFPLEVIANNFEVLIAGSTFQIPMASSFVPFIIVCRRDVVIFGPRDFLRISTVAFRMFCQPVIEPSVMSLVCNYVIN